MEQVLDLFLKEAEASDAQSLLDFFKDVLRPWLQKDLG